MKLFAPIVMLVTLLSCSLAMAQEDRSIADAKGAASHWLELADSAKYGATWDQAAGSFQAAVTKPAWEVAIRSVRGPFGAVRSRALNSATYTRSLPGAPVGEYLVLQYLTQFEGDRNAVETVTPAREQDGSWKISGYFIK